MATGNSLTDVLIEIGSADIALRLLLTLISGAVLGLNGFSVC